MTCSAGRLSLLAGFDFRDFFGGSSTCTCKFVFDLREEVKKLVFGSDLMREVTLDAGVFTMVMSYFSQYEKGVRKFVLECVQ